MTLQLFLLLLVFIVHVIITVTYFLIRNNKLLVPISLVSHNSKLRDFFRNALVALLLVASIVFLIVSLAQGSVQRSDFTIFEDKEMLVLLDNSPSMGIYYDQTHTLFDISKELIHSFIENSNTYPTELSVFSEALLTLSPMGVNKQFLLEQLKQIKLSKNNDSTAITDALLFGVSRLAQRKSSARQLVIITDGIETKESTSLDYIRTLVLNAVNYIDIIVLRIGDIDSNIVYFQNQEGAILKASKKPLRENYEKFEDFMKEMNVPVLALTNQKDFSNLSSLLSSPGQNLGIVKKEIEIPKSKRLFQIVSLACFLLYLLASRVFIGVRL